MKLLAAFEPMLRAWRADLELVGLGGTFVQPAPRGEKLVLTGRVLRSTQESVFVRLYAHGSARAPAIIAEATLRPAKRRFQAKRRRGSRQEKRRSPSTGRFKLSAKHVLITGASSGIGRALALRHAQDGARLSLFGRDAARLELPAQACRDKGADVASFVVDVQNRAGMAKAMADALALAPLDIVYANAGVATGLSTGQILEDPEAVRATLAINVIGVLNTVEPAIPAMTKRGSGAIAIVGSMAGVRGLPFSPAYCASKAAVYSYAESLRGVLAPHGVDVCMIVPGFVATPMAAATKSWQPGKISDAEAAEIIARGLERRKPVIAFPLFMWCALRFITFLPPRWVDAVMLRFSADVPSTKEKEAV